MSSYKDKLKELTLEEKASLLVGYANMKTRPLDNHDIPSLIMSDGPNGVRRENDGELSIDNSVRTLPATCFPSGTTLANSFDNNLLYEVGKQIGLECRYYGINAILGPAINIKRNPLCGRNFEYYSEDPILSGYAAFNFVKGTQEEKVLACLKHYACNNLEKWRYIGDSIVDKRAINDIYTKSFEIAIRESNPGMVMTAYNQINHQFASENKYLNIDILRKKLGFKGLTVTDWGGMVNRDISLNNGQDVEMPGMVKENIQKIIDGVNSGLIKEETLDNSVLNLLDAIDKTRVERINDETIFDKSSSISLKAALEGAVLLKNKDYILPLKKEPRYVVIGDLFMNMRFQGSGSALINARNIIDNKTSFDQEGIKYDFAYGYDQMDPRVNPKLEDEAIKLAEQGDIILFFGGLTDLSESEGFDRDNMRLDENQIHLINRLVKLNKKIVFIMYGGSPFEIPSFDEIDAMLLMSLPGESGGLALTKLLFGEVSPSGRLSQTWPIKYEDIPFSLDFTKDEYELYKESIFVGYRYYQTFDKEVRFPFGYGLNYGEYQLSNLRAKLNKEYIDIQVDIENKSDISLDVIPQIYVGKVNPSLPSPKKELKAYTRVTLLPKEKTIVNLQIKLVDLAQYSPKQDRDLIEDGEYIIYLSNNADDDIENIYINIKGATIDKDERYDVYRHSDDILNMSDDSFYQIVGIDKLEGKMNKRPYTLETPIIAYRSFFGKIIQKEMLKRGDKIIKDAKKIKDDNERKRQIKSGVFVKKMIVVNCLRSLSYSSAGLLPYEQALGLLYLANGRPFKALKHLTKK